jgi:hypothetical protein
VKLSPKGEQLWVSRYSSEGHDCDRAYSIDVSASGADIYVAGESYMPAGHGQPEGWRIVLLHYTDNDIANGTSRPDWVRTSQCITKYFDHRIRVCVDSVGGAYVGGTALVKDQPKMLLLHYDKQGIPQWQHMFPQDDKHPAIFSDLMVMNGNLFACGTVQRNIEADGLHTNWVTLCLTPGGKPVWPPQYCGGPKNDGNVGAIAQASNGSFYVSGRSRRAILLMAARASFRA